MFHLKELEDHFSISERTALRDITDLEQLGLSFYTQAGRQGGYHLTNNKLLTPIRFNTKEINAIFFVLEAIKKISTTPYSNEYNQIKQKLLKSLSYRLQEQIKLQDKVVHFNSQPSLNKVKYFETLIDACINIRQINVQSAQNSNKEQNFQLLDLFFQAENWFCHAYNEKSATWKILRLEKFRKVEIAINQDSLINRKELVASFKQYEAWVVM
ncbi:WYL domain-containing protein [Lactobacillus taiwanensis]|nr:WYL domain-containing protein [Lactobacillus taiwanensis]